MRQRRQRANHGCSRAVRIIGIDISVRTIAGHTAGRFHNNSWYPNWSSCQYCNSALLHCFMGKVMTVIFSSWEAQKQPTGSYVARVNLYESSDTRLRVIDAVELTNDDIGNFFQSQVNHYCLPSESSTGFRFAVCFDCSARASSSRSSK